MYPAAIVGAASGSGIKLVTGAVGIGVPVAVMKSVASSSVSVVVGTAVMAPIFSGRFFRRRV